MSLLELWPAARVRNFYKICYTDRELEWTENGYIKKKAQFVSKKAGLAYLAKIANMKADDFAKDMNPVTFAINHMPYGRNRRYSIIQMVGYSNYYTLLDELKESHTR